MVACAPDDSLSRGVPQPEEEDPSTIPAVDNDTATPIDLNQDHGWPTAEGYTPLGDMFHLGSVLVAMPPEEEDHGHFYPPNSFVADPNALFGSVNDHDNNDEEEAGNDESDNDTNTNTDGFRDLASSALIALENDYEMTLRGEVRPSFMDAQPPMGPSMPLFDANSLDNNNDTNFANFDSIPTIPPTKPIPFIDTAAVQKAVAGITTPSLQAKLLKWQTETKKDRPSTTHGLIPANPLKAFTKTTPKAVKATANLTRAATMAESLHRLSRLLQCQDQLSIHLIGADHVECESAARVQSVLVPLVRWIGANLYAPRHLKVVLIGPNVPTHMHNCAPINLLQSSTSTRLHSATAICVEASYHDWLTTEERIPDLAVCFNAGIWGYDEWKPTIRALVQCSKSVPFVVTSYTMEEAEDDSDVIQQVVEEQATTDVAKPPGLIWGPEPNYFASKQKRETATAVEGREYRENAAWQAWRL